MLLYFESTYRKYKYDVYDTCHTTCLHLRWLDEFNALIINFKTVMVNTMNASGEKNLQIDRLNFDLPSSVQMKKQGLACLEEQQCIYNCQTFCHSFPNNITIIRQTRFSFRVNLSFHARRCFTVIGGRETMAVSA